MKKILSSAIGILYWALTHAQVESTINVPYTASASPTYKALLYLPTDYSTTTKTYPLLVFCHSASEAADGASSGTGLAKIYNQASYGGPAYFIEHGGWPAFFTNPVNGVQEQFIVVSPQANTWSVSGDQLANIVNYLVATYRVDANRIHLTGVSAGGAGVAEYAAQMDVNEDAPSLTKDVRKYKPADIVPMSGATNDPTQSWGSVDVSDSIPLWGFGDPNHDLYGGFVQDFVTVVNKVKSGYSRFTSFTTGHGPWNPFYNPAYTENFTWRNTKANYSIYSWMLGNSRIPIPLVPVANAGTPQTITLPVNTVSLNGSGSTGNITSYSWTQVSGPGGDTIKTPAGVSTAVTGLTQGVYVFQLTVTGGSTSTVQISVNAAPPPPVANAGAAQTITLPTSQVTLSGSGSTGTITSYAWTQVSGPSAATIATPTTVSTRVSALVQGIYVFQLALNGGSKSTVQVTVNPPPLVANAGAAQTIALPANQVLLNGSASSGIITSYLWTQVAGPATDTIVSPTSDSTMITGLVEGIYVFQLTLNGDHRDSVQVTVNPPPPPVANAGANQTISLPANQTTLDGSASSGLLTSYAWTQLSGPVADTLVTPLAATTVVKGLVQGTYLFQLTVTDNLGTTRADTMTVTVNNGNVSRMINVNIYGGASPYANPQWNNWNVNNGVSSPTLTYSDGTSSGATATLSVNESVVDNGTSYGGTMAPAAVLRFTSYCETTRTLTLNGLKTAATYTIELYASRNSNPGQKSIFAIAGQVSDTVLSFNNLTNKAVFSGIKANSSKKIVITISTPTGYNYVNGFVITELSSSNGATGRTGPELADDHTATFGGIAGSGANASPGLSIYPNPATDRCTLNLNIEQVGMVKTTILDESGVPLRHWETRKEGRVCLQQMTISGLATGTYFILVQVGNWKEIRKLLKR